MSEAEELRLRRRELVVGQQALGVHLGKLLELRQAVVARGRRGLGIVCGGEHPGAADPADSASYEHHGAS